jgi:hypothetical protein
MRSAVLGRSLKFCFRALLVLLAWAFVDQGVVLAGCGSHNIPTAPLSNGLGVGFDSIDRAGEQAVADLTEIPGQPKPCTGPMCSGRPAMPIAPAPPDFQRIGSWAILPLTISLLAMEQPESRLDDGGVRPTHSSCPIFHPPRLSPSLIIS